MCSCRYLSRTYALLHPTKVLGSSIWNCYAYKCPNTGIYSLVPAVKVRVRPILVGKSLLPYKWEYCFNGIQVKVFKMFRDVEMAGLHKGNKDDDHRVIAIPPAKVYTSHPYILPDVIQLSPCSMIIVLTDLSLNVSWYHTCTSCMHEWYLHELGCMLLTGDGPV